MAGVNPLMQKFIDRQIDEINAFHRDERKAQVKNMRMMAKSREGALISAAEKLGREHGQGMVALLRVCGPLPTVEEFPSPLSGEWAGDPTPVGVARALGVDPDEDPDHVWELCDQYEAGYWAVIQEAVR